MVIVAFCKTMGNKGKRNYHKYTLMFPSELFIYIDMSCVNFDHPHFPALMKYKEPEIKLPTATGSSKKQEISRKTPISALLTTPKPLTVWTTTNSGKFSTRWEYQTT